MTGLNPTFRTTLIPAMVFFSVLTGAMLGIPALIIQAREAGILRSDKIRGIPVISILLIPLLTTLMHIVLVSVVIVVTAPLLFDAVLPTNWLGFHRHRSISCGVCSGVDPVRGHAPLQQLKGCGSPTVLLSVKPGRVSDDESDFERTADQSLPLMV